MCPFLIKKLCFSVSALPQGPFFSEKYCFSVSALPQGPFFSQNHGNRGTEPAPVPTEPTERNPVLDILEQLFEQVHSFA